MRRRRRWYALFGILVSVAASLVYAAWPGSSTFTVGTETTYVTEPLDKHGYVDYVTALNQRMSKGITPEGNANTLIWQALGPRPEGGTMPPEYFQWLDIDSPPEEGEYLVSWQKYLKSQVKIAVGNQPNADIYQEIDVLTKPWTAKDRPQLAGWLERNQKPLALATEAAQRPDYYNPMVPERTEEWSAGLVGALVPNVQKCRELAAALVCRAMLLLAERKVDEAWQDLLTCHRLGRLVGRGGTLVELLVGIAMDQTANSADVAFLEHSKLTSKQILACLDDLRRLPPLSTVAEKLDLGERFWLLDTMMLTARHGTAFLEGTPPKSDRFTSRLFTRSINWDPALRNANRWYDRCVAGLRIADRSARAEELAAITQDAKRLRDQVEAIGWIEKTFTGSESRGERIGNVMIAMMLPALDRVQSAVERHEQAQRNLHVAFALAAYQRDHGRYPAKLDELAPKYLSHIPDDLFSEKPLIYRPEDKGYLLYSVGVNGTDDGGRSYDDEPRGDDLSIRMPTLEAARKK